MSTMKRNTYFVDPRVLAFLAFAIAMLVVELAFAGGTGMPWEGPLNNILRSLTGPVAKFAGVVAIVVTGLAFAMGEGGGWFRKGLGIALGLSIAFSASTWVSDFGFAGGATF